VTPSVKEALEALDKLNERTGYNATDDMHADMDTIRACLEAQAAEAECWRVIEGYCSNKRSRYDHFYLECENGYDISFVIGEPDRISPHATRLEALQAAAAWIKKEGSK